MTLQWDLDSRHNATLASDGVTCHGRRGWTKESEKEPTVVAAGAPLPRQNSYVGTEAGSHLDADPGPEIPAADRDVYEPLPGLKAGARALLGADVGSTVR